MILKLRTMSFMELIIFVEVVRCGGITAASQKLGIAKSAVSSQLSKLEDRLGLKLLERSSRRIAVTIEGKQLLPKIESLIAEGALLFQQAELQSSEPSGQVSVALTPDFGQRVVASFFPYVTQRYPKISLICKFNYQFEDMQDTAFDLGVRIGTINDENLVAHKLGEFRRVLVASEQYLEHHPINDIEDLKKVNCLIFSSRHNSRIWSLVSAEDEERTIALDVSGDIAAQSFKALVDLCVAHHGVVYVPAFLVKDHISKRQLRHILPQWHSNLMRVYLVYRFGADKVHRVKAVIDSAKTYLPGLLN
ncbi:LysR family transcriptional regulator [Zooshikella ganghwensis]|uniref:LysR family transcriptional regulator n=2 Tax=Zooshikella ganghwensis TaxID=202772 RepID=A0A4P9VMP7_9GAMM|nr:LysR family transcriptional regulator [Zooshikella ganghwensis]